MNAIQAPSIAGASQLELIKFEVNYAAYTERIEDVNSNKPLSQRIKAASVRRCMKPRLFHSLCILDQINGAYTAEDATDESVKAWFDPCLAALVCDLSDRTEEALATVKFRPMPRDPSSAAENLVLKSISALDEYKASSIIT